MRSPRIRTYSSGSEASDHFSYINERPVDDISLEFFYSSHTITVLVTMIVGLVYFAFTRDDTVSYGTNIQSGISAAIFFFLIVSVLAFPNGPFTRPHPAFWRMVFGLSLLYMLLLTFLIFQDYHTVRGIFEWFFPDLKNFSIDMDEGQWGQNCHDLTFQRLWDSIDFFCFAHLVGWMMKTLLVRHYGILWTISLMWEITEMAFSHLLPNFIECWWDALILDVLLCNGTGIWLGMQICHAMEMRYYTWESIKDIRSPTGKLKRAVLQFTPQSWSAMRWLDPTCSYMRIVAVWQLVIFWQVTELNTFFLKHIFEMPSNHPLVFIRIMLLGLMSAPSIRQYYSYVTNMRCTRVGVQSWVYGCCMCLESIICIKFGLKIFKQVEATKVFYWLLIQFVFSIICVYGCVRYQMWCRRSKMNGDHRAQKSGNSLDRTSRKSVMLNAPESDSEQESTPQKRNPLERPNRRRRLRAT